MGVLIFSGVDLAMNNALFEAAINGDLESVKECVFQGHDVNTLDEDGMAAIHYAAQKGHIGILRFLVEEARVDIELKALSNGRTALNYAAICNQPECFAFLAEQGADINIKDISGSTLLNSILLREHLELLKLFVKYGGDIFEIDANGENSLHLLVYSAVRLSSLGCLNYLLEMGVDPLTKNHEGNTALDHAKVNNREDVEAEIKRFLNAKHDQNTLDSLIVVNKHHADEDFYF